MDEKAWEDADVGHGISFMIRRWTQFCSSDELMYEWANDEEPL